MKNYTESGKKGDDAGPVNRPLMVIPAFRRPAALQRLLDSLNRAVYPDDGVELLISLDGGADERSREVAEAFRFNGGKVRVRQQEKRLGLREHILWCGDRSDEHGSVIVLEEDLMVAPDFYRFAVAALEHYDGEDTVGGIALYACEFNEFAGLPFVPLSGTHDAFFMQAGCSSGQAWSHRHWSEFRSWMAAADPGEIAGDPGLPAKLRSWRESSWKKYYGAWLARSGRYMVYPYQSLTTNCSDPGGEHVTCYFSDYQVRMPLDGEEGWDERPGFRFPATGGRPAGSPVCYDAFMEPCGAYIRQLTGMPELEVDLHGIKPKEWLDRAECCLTVRPSRRPVRHYPLHYRPLEHNMAHPVSPEEGFFVLTRPEDIIRHKLSARTRYRLTRYYMRGHPEKPAFMKGYLAAVVRRLVHRIFGG